MANTEHVCEGCFRVHTPCCPACPCRWDEKEESSIPAIIAGWCHNGMGEELAIADEMTTDDLWRALGEVRKHMGLNFSLASGTVDCSCGHVLRQMTPAELQEA